MSFNRLIPQALAGVADLAAKYNSDGVDVYFLNNSRFAVDIKVSTFIFPIFPVLTLTPTEQSRR
jgi:hypothetical protein